MPRLTRALIRASLIYLLAGLLLAIGTSPGLRSLAGLPSAALRPISIHLITVGWLTQLIMGVIHWMFPRRSQEQPRGSQALVWFAFVALNSGLILRAVLEPAISLAYDSRLVWPLAASAILQFLAALALTLNTWTRVRPR